MSRLVHQLSTPTLALLCLALLGCPPIQTGLVRARVVLRTGEVLVPAPGARCSLDASAQELETDAEGVLRFSGAPPGLHTVGCVATGEGGAPFGVFREVDLPEQRGHGGFVDLGDIELTPIGAPGPVQATAEVRAARITWSPPQSSGGAPITGYRIRSVPGALTVDAGGTATDATVSGLADGTEYTFEVAAVTLHGPGPVSVSNPIRTPRTPSPPLAVRATPSVASAVVSWWAPSELGGAELTGFTVTATPGDLSLTAGPEMRTLRVTGLSPGTVYRFTVVAHNAVGSSAASVETLPLTPHWPPEVSDLLTAGVVGGCVQVDYRLAQADLQPMEVVVEFAAPGSQLFQRATQASSFTAEGVLARSPGAHRFLWDSSRDLPRLNGEVQLRVSAQVAGAAGTPQLRQVTVANGLSFAAPGVTATDPAPVAFAIADFDRNGKLDLVTASQTLDQVSMALGVGDGTFKAGLSAGVGDAPAAIASGDLDGDGILDLAVASRGTDAVEVLIGVGNGTFQPVQSHAAATAPSSVAVGDLNRDGRLDLVVAGTDVAVLLAQGGGSYLGAAHHAAGTAPSSVALGDLDGDGALDLVAASAADGAVVVLSGLGDGGFGPAQTYPVGAFPLSLAVADVDRDGWLDVVTANAGNNGLALLRGSSSGLQSAATFELGGSPAAVVVADLDGDGEVELVATVPAESAIRVVNPVSSVVRTFPTGLASDPLQVADLDGDGRPEVLTASPEGDQLSILRNTRPAACERGFSARPVAPLPAEARGVEVGDLDGDGRLDAVALTAEAVLVFRGSGNGALAASPFSTVLGGPLGALALADLDRDGALDVVVNRTGSATLELLYGNGDGTLQSPVSQAAGLSPAAVTAGDLDGDGVLDLVVVGGSGGQVLRGLASGGFSAAATFDTGAPTESLRALALADLDGDGALEVLAGGEALYVFTSEGLGLPGSAQIIPLDAAVSGRLVVGDLDADGIPDVVAGSTVLLGTAAGMFRRGGASPVPLASGDVDGDGVLDLLSATAVHLGRGDGTFPLSVELGASSVAIALGALDGDAQPDLVLAVAGHLEVARGEGGGTFASPSPPLGTAMQAVVVTELDRDGLPDLVLGAEGVTAHRGAGAGIFLPGAPVSPEAAPTSLVSGDFNRDGRQDVLIAGADGVSLALGDGAGALLLGTPPLVVGGGSRLLLTGDLDRDGALDLVSLNLSSAQLEVHLGGGDGSFSPLPASDLAAAARSAVLGDLDRDGRLDVVITTNADARVLLGNGDGTFQPPAAYSTGGTPGAVALGDFDGDGQLDVVTANGQGQALSLLRGNGDGSLGGPSPVVTALQANALHTADVDGDGALDLVALGAARSEVAVLFGRGDASFRAPRLVAAPGNPRALALSDLDRDGLPDLVAGSVILGR